MNLKAKLKQMKSHLEEVEHVIDTESHRRDDDKQDEIQESFKQLGFHPFYFEGETAYRKKIVYPFSDGERDLFQQLHLMTEYWGESMGSHPLSTSGRSPEELLFFDTETTGLSHGAGNRIFLIGYARVRREGMEVTQHLLKDPGHETAFLTGFLDELNRSDYIVSYNGKSFDWPQVKSRHALLQAMLPSLPETGHIDLLHAARRLWKDELPSCRLAVVEEEKLGITRVDDVPGRMAPILYQEYLFDQHPHALKGIIEHNDQDVRTLVRLYLEITERYLGGHRPMTWKEHLGAAKWAEQVSQYELAELHYTKTIQSEDVSAEVYYHHGQLMKKLKRYDEAKHCLLKATHAKSEVSLKASLELAKLFEHQLKEPCKALQLILGYEEVDQEHLFRKHEIQKRIGRLEKKCRGFH
ncbi:putative exonuclease [Salisediminibacterium beveridgei]|uniref:Putative exonuclease n=2 Tax=Salisediminibacterium beveridgei TaxID=632773 RepID=A0A1D7QVP8_9BACI|nr:putative exonuclease [Salisediminibacterium beveridgei]